MQVRSDIHVRLLRGDGSSVAPPLDHVEGGLGPAGARLGRVVGRGALVDGAVVLEEELEGVPPGVHHEAELVVVELLVPVLVELAEAGVHVARAEPTQRKRTENERRDGFAFWLFRNISRVGGDLEESLLRSSANESATKAFHD